MGPTGVGKTDLSVEVARRLGTAVVSCDSRQVYREMRIGTAAPTEAQLAAVPHYLVREVSVREYFNCWQFERRALEVIRGLLEERDSVVMAGGSMMYVDAVCEGIDEVPDVRPEVRERVGEAMRERGPEFVREWLRRLDPAHYGRVDLRNWKRVAHAVEVCLSSGRPYSSFLTGRKREREFAIVKAGLWREREELYGRIDRRVDELLHFLELSTGVRFEIKDKVIFVKWSDYTVKEYDSDYNAAMFRAGSGGAVAVFNRESDRTDNRIVLFNTKGEKISEFEFKQTVSDIQVSGGHIYCMSDTEVFLLSDSGEKLRSADCGFGAVWLAVTGSNETAVITDNRIDKVKLVQ